MARKRLTQAINEALVEEMERDSDVVLFGEDVQTSLFGDTRGLVDRFGTQRVRDTPICEALLAGMAVGAAASGRRPILHLMYGNFLYTAFDAIANQAAKLRYMTGGQMRLPVVFMAVYGAGRSIGAQHSDVPYPALMNLGGLKVVVPATPADAKGLLKAAIRDDAPTVFLQPIRRGGEQGDVPGGDVLVPIGQGRIVRPGADVTVVAIGAMLRHAVRAAEAVADEGIDAEVVDPRTVFPLDESMIIDSVRRTGRLVVVDEARRTCGAAAEIAALVFEHAFESLKAPVRRVTVADVAIPYAPSLEEAVLPDEAGVMDAIRSAVAGAGAGGPRGHVR
ncbi:MAG: pyruvate dehydrogenase complex E1 component subunit beta [Burkholderiaceae bacterium]|nr:pyruvate dehydrogenase complex E1 component subunit beta [Burkholderiaceae bacterium]